MLLVSRPIVLPISQSLPPSGAHRITAYAAGPGFPRDAPSILATCTPAGGAACDSSNNRALDGGDVFVVRFIMRLSGCCCRRKDKNAREIISRGAILVGRG